MTRRLGSFARRRPASSRCSHPQHLKHNKSISTILTNLFSQVIPQKEEEELLALSPQPSIGGSSCSSSFSSFYSSLTPLPTPLPTPLLTPLPAPLPTPLPSPLTTSLPSPLPNPLPSPLPTPFLLISTLLSTLHVSLSPLNTIIFPVLF